MSREQSVTQYQSLLAELENWVSSASQLVSANVQDIPVAELQNQLTAHKVNLSLFLFSGSFYFLFFFTCI